MLQKGGKGHHLTWYWWDEIRCFIYLYLSLYPYISRLLISLIARFMGPIWGPPGADRTQVGPILATWTFLSGMDYLISQFMTITFIINCGVKYLLIPSFNEATVEIWELKSNFIPRFIGQMNTYPCWIKWIHSIKRDSLLSNLFNNQWVNKRAIFSCHIFVMTATKAFGR